MEVSTITMILDTTLVVVFTWVAYKTGSYIWKYTPYSYPNARIRAMEARLLSDQRLLELAESKNLENFVVNLEDSDYGKRFSELKAYSVEEIEKALDLSFVDTILLFQKIMPKRVRGFFEVMLEEWDVRNIVNVVKAKITGLPAQDFVIPVGKILNKVKAMAEAKTMEEILVILEGTEYEEPIRKLVLKEINLPEFEHLMYSLYYQKLLNYANSRKGEEKAILSEFVSSLIDSKNISLILRAKASGINAEKLKTMLIPGGSISRNILEGMISAEDPLMALTELEKTKYAEVVKNSREVVEKGDISIVEKQLRRYIQQRMKELSQFYPLSVAVALSYMLQKEYEIRKLKAIARLIADGIRPERIKEIVGEVA
ncbi:MAG: V/A-type H+/Na+-transporting ATPase subunit [Pyrococcus sp.]|uniref:V-type ATP synthase subunit C n=1 Tax=Pyrococcus sp. TaxID=33866 RepID=UPI00258672AA|nr:V-type ATP synthase subunit C [Pyrococcus sp.]MDK2869934.1 V/A-type H+/Na+-transporting ATPase subunit [Pyrococcus sp.]